MSSPKKKDKEQEKKLKSKPILYLEERLNNPSKPKKQVAEEVGYAETTARAVKSHIENTDTYQEALKKVNDSLLLGKTWDIALDDQDKRANLQAIDMLLKLKDRYPSKKLKLGKLGALSDVIDVQPNEPQDLKDE